MRACGEVGQVARLQRRNGDMPVFSPAEINEAVYRRFCHEWFRHEVVTLKRSPHHKPVVIMRAVVDTAHFGSAPRSRRQRRPANIGTKGHDGSFQLR